MNVYLLDEVYRKVLNFLTLSKDHKKLLLDKGLNEKEIVEGMFRSITFRDKNKLIPHLRQDYTSDTLIGVPGFEVGGSGVINFSMKEGIVFPVKDYLGNLVSLKIRTDDGDPKYLAMKGSYNSLHFPKLELNGNKQIRITEGEIKAIIASRIGYTCSMNGVNDLKSVEYQLKQKEYEKVLLSLDSDYRFNPNVEKALINLILTCENYCNDVIIEYWDSKLGKGIDDVIVAGMENHIYRISSSSFLTDVMNIPMQELLKKMKNNRIFFEMAIRAKRDIYDYIKENYQSVKGLIPRSLRSEFEVSQYSIVPLESNSIEYFPHDRGFILNSDRSIWFSDGEKVQLEIISHPVYITGGTYDDVTEEYSYILEWEKDGKIFSRDFPGSVLFDPSEIKSLLKYNISIPASMLARQCLCTYLTNLKDRANFDFSRSSSKVGFMDDFFINGEKVVMKNGEEASSRDKNSGLPFLSKNNSTVELGYGFKSKGDFGIWLNTISPFMQYKHVLCTVLASMSSMLLAKYNVKSYMLSLDAKSSSGKSSAIRMAASCFGNPDEGAEKDKIIHSWNGTGNYREQAMSTFSCMPYFLDDTQSISSKTSDDRLNLIREMIYCVSGNGGKGRGGQDGQIRLTRTFRTVCITSSESCIYDGIQEEGTRARCISLGGSPYNDHRFKPGTLEKMTRIIMDNYGHMSLKMARYIMSKDKFDVESLDSFQNELCELAEVSNIGTRVAVYFSLMNETGRIMDEIAGTKNLFHRPDLIREVFKDNYSKAEDTDPVRRCFKDLREWINTNNYFFWSDKEQVKNQTYGRWDKNVEGDRGKEIFISASIIPKALDSMGYKNMSKTMISEFLKEGYFTCKKAVRIMGAPTTCYKIDDDISI